MFLPEINVNIATERRSLLLSRTISNVDVCLKVFLGYVRHQTHFTKCWNHIFYARICYNKRRRWRRWGGGPEMAEGRTATGELEKVKCLYITISWLLACFVWKLLSSIMLSHNGLYNHMFISLFSSMLVTLSANIHL